MLKLIFDPTVALWPEKPSKIYSKEKDRNDIVTQISLRPVPLWTEINLPG